MLLPCLPKFIFILFTLQQSELISFNFFTFTFTAKYMHKNKRINYGNKYIYGTGNILKEQKNSIKQ